MAPRSDSRPPTPDSSADPRPLAPGPSTAWNGFEAVLKGRRSVRDYLPAAVPEEDLEAVLDAGRWAPSPHNAEPWRFVVLRQLEAKERLCAAMGRRWQTDLAADGVASDLIAGEVRKSRERITGAPIVILACLCNDGLDQYPDAHRQQAELLMAAHSLGAAVQNIMLAAYARGLATGWMCAPLFCPDVVLEALDLPTGLFPQGLITLGYPRAWPKVRARRPMPELVIEA